MAEPVSERDALHDYAVELDTTNPASDDDGLAELCEVLADARIVGLGEGTHGTREFFELKHRIVRELVESHGLRTFAIETAVGEAQRVNDYVRDGEGTAEDVVGSLRFWTWKTEAVLAFVEWLREFNRGRDRDDQVEFWGVDVQFGADAADAVVAYLEAVPTVATVDGLAEFAEEGLYPEADRDEDDLARASDVAEAVIEHLETNRDALVAATSDRDWTIARQHARSIEHAVELAMRRAAHNDEDDEPPANAISYRDRAMAENTEWLLDEIDAEHVALWAHNDHVKRGPMTWTDHDQSIPSLGDRLSERDVDYHPVAFTFGHGSFQAIGDLPDAEEDRGLRAFEVDRPARNSLEATFASLEGDVVVLDIAGTRADAALVDWIAADHDTRSIGALYDPDDADDYWSTLDLERDFDIIVYVDETARARPLGER